MVLTTPRQTQGSFDAAMVAIIMEVESRITSAVSNLLENLAGFPGKSESLRIPLRYLACDCHTTVDSVYSDSYSSVGASAVSKPSWTLVVSVQSSW